MATGVGNRIREARKHLGLSQDDLAKRMGLKNKSSICKVERGDDNLTTDTVKKYAAALNCTPAYLMGWEDEHGNDISDTSDSDIRKKALSMYESYLQANPEIQSAIDTLLKVNQ